MTLTITARKSPKGNRKNQQQKCASTTTPRNLLPPLPAAAVVQIVGERKSVGLLMHPARGGQTRCRHTRG
jgi:hypothetical protein